MLPLFYAPQLPERRRSYGGVVARADVQLSQEQLEYRAEVVEAARAFVEARNEAAARDKSDDVGLLASWCAVRLMREAEADLRRACDAARTAGGASISAELVEVFQRCHGVQTVRKAAKAARADRHEAEAWWARREASERMLGRGAAPLSWSGYGPKRRYARKRAPLGSEEEG